jgi:hypothetical protein
VDLALIPGKSTAFLLDFHKPQRTAYKSARDEHEQVGCFVLAHAPDAAAKAF